MARSPRSLSSSFKAPPSVSQAFKGGISAAFTAPGAILLVATYELGHQPLSLAAPLATLRAAGFAPVARDTSVEELSDAEIRAARLVAIATPMHTALRLGAPVAERVRALNPRATVLFYGLYATLNAEMLLGGDAPLADAVAGGEYQRPLLALAQALASGAPLADAAIPGLQTGGRAGAGEASAARAD